MLSQEPAGGCVGMLVLVHVQRGERKRGDSGEMGRGGEGEREKEGLPQQLWNVKPFPSA